MSRVLFTAPQGVAVSVEYDQVPNFLGGGFLLQNGAGSVVPLTPDGTVESIAYIPVDRAGALLASGWSSFYAVDHA